MARHLAHLMAIMIALWGPAARAAEPSPALDAMIAACAAEYKLPAKLLHRVIKRESNYNPTALFRGHWGLMQIKYATAKSMGYRGTPQGAFRPGNQPQIWRQVSCRRLSGRRG